MSVDSGPPLGDRQPASDHQRANSVLPNRVGALPLLALEKVSLSIHDTPILHDISLTLATGKTLGVIGESGSGKSMTALSIMQLLPRGAKLSGCIRFDNQTLTDLDEAALCELRGSDIGMIFQEPMTALNPVKNIGDQVSESIRLHRTVSRDEAQRLTRETLERVGLPNDEFPLARYPHELSGGQRQRVVIAIAIACKPKLLIADEPTTALDVTTQAGILDLLRSLQATEGLALMLITHDLAVVADMADDVVIMRQGRIVESGPRDCIFKAPQHEYTLDLFAASAFVPGKRQKQASGNVSAPLLSVQNLICEYPVSRRGLFKPATTFRAVDDVSLDIRAGESVGLVGESGCGKSTLTRALLGLMPIHSGVVQLNGESVSHAHRVSRRVRQQMQIVFQDPYGSFNPRHKVARLVAEPLHVLDSPPEGKVKNSRVVEVLESVGMSADDRDKYIHEFSGGQRQRIAIARALIINPALIILDEAVSALDVSVRAQVLELLSSLAAEKGLAYLFISHDLSVVRRVTDRVLVMKDGRIVERGDTETVFVAPQDEYTQALIGAAPRLEF
ncbi:MAG: dipeptide ABC transporter ATP-binding protein [Granulosicoccus sp.]